MYETQILTTCYRGMCHVIFLKEQFNTTRLLVSQAKSLCGMACGMACGITLLFRM